VSPQPQAIKVASYTEKDTEYVHDGKSQITSTKLQINFKSQYPMTETHFPCGRGFGNLKSTIRQQ